MLRDLPRRWKVFLAVGAVTALADQLTKVWARAALETDAQGRGISSVLIENFWEWRLSQNPGSAFGLFQSTSGSRIFLSIIGVIAVGAILWMLHQAKNDQRRLTWALGLVAGGAVGNLIDRIYFGTVTDFWVWKYYEHEWPTFNVADVALVVGVGLLFIDLGKEAAEEKKAAKDEGGGSGGKPGKSKSKSKSKGKGKKR